MAVISTLRTISVAFLTLKWTHTPEEVFTLGKASIAEVRAGLDKIGSLAPEECTFDSVFLARAEIQAKRRMYQPLSFYGKVAPSKELRDAANEVESLVGDYAIESSMRMDVFRALQAAEKNIKESGRALSAEEQRLVDKMLLEGRRNGLALPDGEREKVTKLKKELSQACLEFSKNYNEENGFVSFTLEALKGVPEDSISGYKKRMDGNKEVYDVTFKHPDISPVITFAEDPETRRIANERFEARLDINKPIMSKFLNLRRQIAKLLGYTNWAEYKTEVVMAKNAKTVDEFLTDLEQRLRPIGRKEYENLLALKKEEHDEKGLPFDGEFYLWDSPYYSMKYKQRVLKLNALVIKEHFPVSFVVPAILNIYQNLLGVKFIAEMGETWHPDVQMFAVWEKDAKDESDFLGYCYLDLYPREGKYPHASVFPLLPGYEKPDGSRSYPVAAMVANLAKPTPTKPALMGHFDVTTLFHEMGHLFHEVLSKTKFAKFHGTDGAIDFVEAPSQMLENWCFEPKVLKVMSSHHETKKPLDDELIDKIIKSRYVNMGMFYLRQLFLAKFDLKVHMDQESTDYSKLWNDMRESVALVKTKTANAGEAGFNHIASAYDVGYYGYTWSLVFATDMYATVFKKDPFSSELGKLYREKVLLPGASRDETDILRAFLGRPPSSEAFIQELFGTSGVDAMESTDLGIEESN